MKSNRSLTKIALGALVAGSFAAAPLIGAGAAQAEPMESHTWCPGNPKNMPYVVNSLIDWDWNVCHTWFPTNYGMGNVSMQGRPTSIWDGTNPPPEAIERHHCPPIAFMCP